MKGLMGIAAAALAISIDASASAQLTSAVTADELEQALADADMNPSMLSDQSNGAPVASGEAGEFKFWVRALDCAGTPPSCRTLMFFANFNLGRQVTAKDYLVINSFNEGQVFGRAYLIEGGGQVGVDYVIELDGGVAKDHLAKNIGRWRDVVGAFVDKFREGQARS